MRVAVIGGAGYLGGALTDLLQSTEHDVTVYDSLVFEDHYLKDVKFINGDIRDYKKLSPLLQEADVVVWLAAIVGDGACALNPELSAELNQESVKWRAAALVGLVDLVGLFSLRLVLSMVREMAYLMRTHQLDHYRCTQPLN